MVPPLRMDHVPVAGVLIHHTMGGPRGAQPILFIHGLSSAGYIEWRHNLGPLAARNRVFAPDLPGFGRSEIPSAPYGIPYFARIMAGYLDACGLRQVVAVGMSLGGRIAIELALRYPGRIRALVLVDSLGLGWPSFQPHYPLIMLPGVGEALMRMVGLAIPHVSPGLLRRVAARQASPSADPSVVDDDALVHLRETLADSEHASSLLATVRSLLNPRFVLGEQVIPRLSASGIPTLLLWGADDPLFPVAHAERAHQLIPGSRLVIITGAGHQLPAERPEAFNQALADFLSEQGRGR